ncbi:MAG: hypothetical protein ACRDP6_42130 [Actinoallomurus sp.]
MTDAAFQQLAQQVIDRNADNLLNSGPDEQIERAVEQLHKFAKTTPIAPITNTVIDLAGFGEAAVHFSQLGVEPEQYLLLSEVAEALGVPPWKACAWARQEHQWAIEDQRHDDEQRGDGRLGWDRLRDHVDLGFEFLADDPEAKPDADGRRWSDYGDWLISRSRLLAFICASPWGPEFIDNAKDHMGIGFMKTFGDKLTQVKTYGADGEPTGGTAASDLFHTDLTEEEALRKATRGPVGPVDED